MADENWYPRFLKTIVQYISGEGYFIYGMDRTTSKDDDQRDWNADLFCVCLSHGLDT